MRVLFDAYWWDDGPIANRTVQREVILAWAERFPDDEIVLALPRGAAATDAPSGARVERTRLWPHGFANRWELGRLRRRVGADAVVVHNFAPRGDGGAVFIHDAMFVDHPEWFSRSERLYFRFMIPWSRSAAVVATSTETEARRIGRLTGRAVVATGLGIPPLLSGAEERRPALPDGVTDFALTVGRLNVRKNLERILGAAAHSARIDPQHPLVVVGGTAHSGVGSTISADVQRLIDDGRIVMLGGVSDAELAWLYRHAAVAVTLSLDEGFGLPAVEAAQFDTPLVASDIPVFRETVGDYARFVDPLAAPEVVAEAIDAAWAQHSDGAAIRRRYTWTAAVETLRAALAG